MLRNLDKFEHSCTALWIAVVHLMFIYKICQALILYQAIGESGSWLQILINECCASWLIIGVCVYLYDWYQPPRGLLAFWDCGFESRREAWKFVSCEGCVLSGRGVYEELIARLEKSYRMWFVFVCDLETSRMWRSWLALGQSATGIKCVLFHPIFSI